MKRRTKPSIVFVILIGILPSAWCQTTVTGIVRLKGERSPAPGINVVEMGTQNGTVTDNDGRFTLEVHDANATLVFSFIGCITQQVALEGRSNVNIVLRVDCIKDWFDAQEIGLSINSGVIHNPFGAQLDATSPAFMSNGILKGGIEYQTNFAENHFLNIKVGLMHFASSCYFDMDAIVSYRNVTWNDKMSAAAYSVENSFNVSNKILNINYLKVIVGASAIDFNNKEENEVVKGGGVLLGLGTFIGKPFYSTIMGKVNLYNGKREYFGEITKNGRRINWFVRYYNLASFTELSIGVGTNFTYLLRKQKVKDTNR